jgi:hypothetical protein
MLFGRSKLSSFWLDTIKRHVKGFFLRGLLEGITTQKRRLEEALVFCLFGNFIGFPGLFNYYHLRLLPYYIGQLHSWKRRVLREKDFFDHISD